ncbi:hypothetical protein CDD83_9181 [Cordyceps sp. RAO-2017]|nr:hypothetical protein CDD83_9181 [Cordyceps sp. RAO-2017]
MIPRLPSRVALRGSLRSSLRSLALLYHARAGTVNRNIARFAQRPEPEAPPSYDEPLDDGLVLPPATLHVAGRFVYSDNVHSPPLYELSHSVGFLRDTDRLVRVERLDHSVRDLNGSPQLSTRTKHLYDLKHPSIATSPTFLFHADTTSRQSLCSFGITSFRPRKLSTAKGYRVSRTGRGSDRQLVPRDALFTALPASDDAVTFEWFDPDDCLVARELDRSGMTSLLISAEMSLRARDALVAAWMLKLWWERAGLDGRIIRWRLATEVM